MKTIQQLVEREMMDTGREMQKEEGKILDDVKTLATMETVTRKQTNQSLKHTGRTGKTTWKKGNKAKEKKACCKTNIHIACLDSWPQVLSDQQGSIVTSFLVIKRGSSYALLKHQSAKVAFSSNDAVFVARKMDG